MPYHRISDLPPPAGADIDTPAMAACATAFERGEADLRALTRLLEIGMDLAEAQGQYARSRLAAASSGQTPLAPGENPVGAFDKIAQTVRRIAALKSKLAADMEKRGAGLAAERADRRARRAERHKRAVDDQIGDALTDAFTEMYGDGDGETDEGDALCREMLSDSEDLLADLEEFKDYLDRPVGETVVKLCAALGLAPDACVADAGAWWAKRPPTPYQIFRAARDAEPDRSPDAAFAGRPP